MQIKGQEIALKFNLRSMMVYEQITGKQFSIDTLTDEIVYFYSVVIASNPTLELLFDEFVEIVDNEDMLNEFKTALERHAKMKAQFKQEESDGAKKN